MMNKIIIVLAVVSLMVSSCAEDRSSATGWSYNDADNGDFQKSPFVEQETGPNLVLIEGGTFVMGRVSEDVMRNWDNSPRRVTVSSFYIDQTEVRNIDWLEYLYWVSRVYGADYPEVYKNTLPDTLVWRDKLAYNEPYVENYLRYPSTREYPVVGVSWTQATDFCAWRTDRVNEQIMIREGFFNHNPNQVADDNFNTGAYLSGQYEGDRNRDGIEFEGPNSPGFRNVQTEDGILLPNYRLPTEAEWEYAAYGTIGNSFGENVIEKREWPWNGHSLRNPQSPNTGSMLANYKRGRGDNMGLAGRLNDNGDITTPVISYWPNDYGLYNMAGNVNEWVMDVYRANTSEDVSDFRSFRGNKFQKIARDEDGFVAEKDSLGRMTYVDIEAADAKDRRNYRTADNINYLDGDFETQTSDQLWKSSDDDGTGTNDMYEYGVSSLVSDQSRVYKGGSWKDRAYWLHPGTRRFLDENIASDDIGFRCAMDRMGSPAGLGSK